jgi:hypothetical protein
VLQLLSDIPSAEAKSLEAQIKKFKTAVNDGVLLSEGMQLSYKSMQGKIFNKA